MGLAIRCGDICGTCDFVAHGETEEEIILKLVEHIKVVHGLIGIDKIVKEKFRKFICEENPA